jgi:hypothetical protein
MIALLNGMDTIPKSGSLHKSIILVCFPEKTETKHFDSPLWQFTPALAPWRGDLVQLETSKEKEHDIHFHSFNIPKKGGGP